ncbi:ectonucleoside triphosphate diphosphohydrolase 5-like [Contarinia nasturtii]|uniref:ectonucleoside triphosphate diphosphohydrolase 5-like n=1 Tax=Contarinia nasturtii TaxID=265458 RepID=UPI0012D4327C|nr:ectonucleoside triphosphate diphosphohydrolase 5-like [Contarinia nasturtii]
MKLFLFATLLVGCYVFNCASGFNINDVQYSVVIDAGSTGNRATAYKFNINRKTKQFILDDGEEYVKEHGGLGTFVDPSEAAEKIKILLEKLKEKLNLPSEVLGKTPLVLKATGGLRKLNPLHAEKILVEVRKVLQSSGFLVKGNAASIISGVDEGIFSWFSINYISGHWGTKNFKTVVALDLGGASTQVTFALSGKSEDPWIEDNLYTVSTSVPKAKAKVFSTSYMDLGAEAVRLAVFSHGNPEGATHLHTVCMHPDTKPSLKKFGTTLYTMYGIPHEKSTGYFDVCRNLVKEKVLHLLSPKPSPLKNESEVYAFSGFYFRFRKTGLINREEGGQVTLEDILSSAQKACSVPNNKNPYLCLDLTYMYVLLSDGYELGPDTKVNFHQKLNGHDISWALAVAYDQLVGLRREKIEGKVCCCIM